MANTQRAILDALDKDDDYWDDVEEWHESFHFYDHRWDDAGRKIYNGDYDPASYPNQALEKLLRDFGYVNWSDLSRNCTEEDAKLVERFCGPHGKTLHAIWKAKNQP